MSEVEIFIAKTEMKNRSLMILLNLFLHHLTETEFLESSTERFSEEQVFLMSNILNVKYIRRSCNELVRDVTISYYFKTVTTNHLSDLEML